MVDHLIEIIFKNIEISKIEWLLKDLISSGEINNYYFSFGEKIIDWNEDGCIEKIVLENNSFGFFVNFKNLNIDYLKIKNVGFAIYRYEEGADFEINFKLFDVEIDRISDLTELLMRFSKRISKKFCIEEYFCGLEPATEKSTQLFSKETKGPLFLR